MQARLEIHVIVEGLSAPFELNQDIDVAILSLGAGGVRAEQTDLPHAQLPQLSKMVFESPQDLLLVHRYGLRLPSGVCRQLVIRRSDKSAQSICQVLATNDIRAARNVEYAQGRVMDVCYPPDFDSSAELHAEGRPLGIDSRNLRVMSWCSHCSVAANILSDVP